MTNTQLKALNEAHMAVDEQCDSAPRTVERVLAEFKASKQALEEIATAPMPLCELAQLRKLTHEYIVHRNLVEVQAIVDGRALIARAKAA